VLDRRTLEAELLELRDQEPAERPEAVLAVEAESAMRLGAKRFRELRGLLVAPNEALGDGEPEG
jgi:hypothetical protein